MRRCARIVLAVAPIGLLLGCPADEPEPATPPGASPEAEAPAIPQPDLDAMEPQVSALLRDRRAAVEARPDSAEAWWRYGAALDAHDQVRSAISAYTAALEREAGSFRLAYNLAVARELADDGDPQVPAAYRAALDLDPRYAPAHMRLGDALVSRGANDEALEAYRTAIGLDPSLRRARRSLGQLLLAEGATSEALEHLRAVALDVPDDGPTQAALAQALAREGAEAEARRAAAKAGGADLLVFADPVRAQVLGLAVSSLALTRRANRALADGRLEDAIGAYRQLLDVDPSDAGALVGLGEALAGQRRFGEAAEALARGLALAPEATVVRWQLGAALAQDGQLDRALDEFERAVDEAPDRARGRVNYGNTLVAADRVEDALAEYRRAIAIDETYALAHYALGSALRRLGRERDAQVSLDRAAELDPRFRAP